MISGINTLYPPTCVETLSLNGALSSLPIITMLTNEAPSTTDSPTWTVMTMVKSLVGVNGPICHTLFPTSGGKGFYVPGTKTRDLSEMTGQGGHIPGRLSFNPS